MTKAAIYTRVSSTAQVEGFSLEAQYDKLIEYINSNGWELIQIYSDPGVSAKDLNRPSVKEMIQDLKDGKFEAILVHKLDRLTRNISNLYDLVELVNKHNVKLISHSENIDTSTPMGRMFVYILGIFAQMYRENLAEEVIKGQSKRAEKGLRNTPARPYGYEVGEDLKLSLNEEEAPTVKQIYEWYLSGLGQYTIMKRLNEKQVPTGKGAKWSTKKVNDILNNRTYIGATSWKAKSAPEENRIVVLSTHDSIIEPESFEQVRDILNRKNKQEMSRSSYDFIFSSILKCGICGCAYHGKMSTHEKPTRNYRCSGRHRRNDCTGSDISEGKLIKLFFGVVRHFFEDVQESKPVTATDIDTVKERKRIERDIEKSKDRHKQWARAMSDGKMPYQVYKELVDEENERVNGLREELAKYQTTAPAVKKSHRDVANSLKKLHAEWNTLTQNERKIIVQKDFKAIIIGKIEKEWQILGYDLNV